MDEIENWEKIGPLRKWREAKSMGTLEAAGELEIPLDHIRRMEQGFWSPTDAELSKLADKMGNPDFPKEWVDWRRRRPNPHPHVIPPER